MRGGLVATMDDERRVLTDGAVLAVPGKRADIVAIDPRQPVRNVEAALVHGSPQVRHVWVDGRPALLDGRVHGEEAILADAHLAGERVAARADLPGATGWLCDYRTS